MAAQPLATLIGDVVGSKQFSNRAELQRSLAQALRSVNTILDPPHPLEPTIGDEFQGGFSSVASAERASLLLRLTLLGRNGADSRYGVGYGVVEIFEANRSPTSQDGPGWWSARAAIDRAKRLGGSTRTSFVRSSFERWPEEESMAPTEAAAVDAFLICRDAIVDQMPARTRRLLLGMLLGEPQAQLAADEGVTQSAVSQSLARGGAFAIEAGQLRLEEELR